MYKRLPVEDSRAGIVWSPALSLLSVLTAKKPGKSHGDMQTENNVRLYKELDAASVRQPKIRTTYPKSSM
jgi:hypothetical protein